MERQCNGSDAGPSGSSRNFVNMGDPAIDDPPVPESEDSEGTRTASEISDYPPSISCPCGTCPSPSVPVKQRSKQIWQRPNGLRTIVDNDSTDDCNDGNSSEQWEEEAWRWFDSLPKNVDNLPTNEDNDSTDDDEVVIVEPPLPEVWYISSDSSFPRSSPSAPQSPDSRVTVSDSSPQDETDDAANYDGSDEYAEGDDLPDSSTQDETDDAANYDGSDEYAEGDDLPSPTQVKESSSEPEPDPAVVSIASQHSSEPLMQVPRDLGELDPDLGASCEVSNTPPQSPLRMMPRRRVYTSEEESGNALPLDLRMRTRKRCRPRQWQIPPWEIAPGSRGGQRKTYFAGRPVVPPRRRRRSLRHTQAKRIRLDNTSGAREGPE